MDSLASRCYSQIMHFTWEQIEAFRELSHDRNPLHGDRDYAHRTPYGEPVVFGVAALLQCLGAWSKGKSFSLVEFRAVFQKAIVLGVDYDLFVSEENSKVKLRLQRGGVTYCSLRFSYEQWTEETQSKPDHFASLQEAQSNVEPNRSYSLNRTAINQFESVFQLQYNQMPLSHWQAFMWSSYTVGMEQPGRQALFSELKFQFLQPRNCSTLQIEELRREVDSRFNRVEISGSATGLTEFNLVAFARPENVSYSMNELQELLKPNARLANKSVYVSGASRGFGAVLSQCASLEGAKLTLHYRSDDQAIADLAKEIEALGASVTTLKGDAASDEVYDKLTDQKFDFLFLNAGPPARSVSPSEWTAESLRAYQEPAGQINQQIAKHLLSRLSPGGTAIYSSSQFVVTKPEDFSHYSESKLAGEAAMSTWAQQNPDHFFLCARLPRMLTDQTNLPFDLDPPQRASVVAKDLFHFLFLNDHTENFQVKNFFDGADS